MRRIESKLRRRALDIFSVDVVAISTPSTPSSGVLSPDRLLKAAQTYLLPLPGQPSSVGHLTNNHINHGLPVVTGIQLFQRTSGKGV